MKPVIDFIVPWVRESESYNDKHMDFAWLHPEIVRMMSNENLISPSQKVLDAILEAARVGNLYPDTGPILRKKLGEKAGLTEDNVVLGNGSTDVINFIIASFVAPGDEVVISVPTFPMYETRTRVLGGKPVLVPMTPDFYWDVDKIIAAVTEKTKLIFICSPNNPTGNQMKESDMRRILALGVPTFLDEAYYELEENAQTRAFLLKEYPNAIINRTFSKAFGLAGLRVGYALASTEVISYLNRMKIPWNVSLLALAAANAGFDDVEDQQKKRKTIIDGRNYIFNEINAIPGLKAFPSEGNFTLIDASDLGKTSGQIKDDMIERGIFIRPMSGHNMKPGFIRVTIGSAEQNHHFMDVFKAYIAEIRK
jgi:histidinol-phosphate aminotransferase